MLQIQSLHGNQANGFIRAVEFDIELEVWTLPTETIGSFLAGVASPLALGTVELDDGSRVHGFLCEAHAVQGAEDISYTGEASVKSSESAPATLHDRSALVI